MHTNFAEAKCDSSESKVGYAARRRRMIRPRVAKLQSKTTQPNYGRNGNTKGLLRATLGSEDRCVLFDAVQRFGCADIDSIVYENGSRHRLAFQFVLTHQLWLVTRD